MSIYQAKIKIIFVLIISFILAGFVSKNLFLANSPRINETFLANLKAWPQDLIASIVNRGQPDYKKFENLPVTALKPVASGVYAGEENGNVVYIRVTKDAQYEERVINYEGKQITIRVPKGTFK